MRYGKLGIVAISAVMGLMVVGCVPPMAPAPGQQQPPPSVRVVPPPPPEPRREPAVRYEGPVSVIRTYAAPNRVRRGGEVELVAEYFVSGRQRGSVDVLETFEVRRDGILLSMPSMALSRTVGDHEAKYALTVPDYAEDGTYTVTATISTEDGEDTGEGSFVVR